MINDIEATVLSGLLRSSTVRQKYLDQVADTDFSAKSHRSIYQVLLRLLQSTQAITKELLQESMVDMVDKLTVTMLYDYDIPEITADVFLRFKSAGRLHRLTALQKYLAKEIPKGGDIDVLIDTARQHLSAVESADAMVELSSPDQSVEATQTVLERWSKGEHPVVTALPEIDSRLFLSQFIGYWIIAGNSGSGKSAMMINIAKNNAKAGIPMTVCSLEMSRELLYIRMAMEDPKIAGLELTEQTVRNAALMSDLNYAVEALRKLPIYVVQGVSNIFRLDKISRRNAIERGCKATLFDYIQLGKTSPTDSDVVRVSGVSRVLQGLTVPDLPNGYHGQTVIALSQYNGEGSKLNTAASSASSGPGRPTVRRAGNDDLAWSSQIRQDADGILHLYSSTHDDEDTVDVTVYCGKQRNYKAGWSVGTKFIRSEQRFTTELADKQRKVLARPKSRAITLK